MPAADAQQQQLPDRLKSLGSLKVSSQDGPETVYATFIIERPKPDAIVRNVQPAVDITVKIEPPLSEEHFLQLYLDGLEVGEKTKLTALTLQEIVTGIHRLQGKIISTAGEEIMKTQEISFEFRKLADLSKIAPNLAPETAQ
jgi:hypothetical protein